MTSQLHPPKESIGLPDLSIIIVNWNTRNLLVECLNSLYGNAPSLSYDIWVVDNASSDSSVGLIETAFPKVHLITNSANKGFARANNQAMHASQGRYMLLFNSDAMATHGAIQALLDLAVTQPRAGIIGARLINFDGSFQASYTPFPNLWQEFLTLTGLGRLIYGRWYPSRGPEEDKGPQQVDYIEGACLLVRREAFEQVGGLDERYFMYAEEVDWCYSMKQSGWQVWYQPAAKIIHHGGGSSRQRKSQREAALYRSRVRFFRKHHGNLSAVALKTIVYGTVAVKIPYHGTLRRITRGHCGRHVTSMAELYSSLRGV
ncbi:MAG: glycosyltransferase family 2 protein [Acidobacteria bacterium]|nr:glycosyltransferase family 2 protein [Acidobacteriota bacterium]